MRIIQMPDPDLEKEYTWEPSKMSNRQEEKLYQLEAKFQDLLYKFQDLERKIEERTKYLVKIEEKFDRANAKQDLTAKSVLIAEHRLEAVEVKLEKVDERKKEMSNVNTNESIVTRTKSAVKGDLEVVAPRLAARQTARLARSVLLAKNVFDRFPMSDEQKTLAKEFLSTPLGESCLSVLLGTLLTNWTPPGVTRGPKLDTLAIALRQEGEVEIGDQLTEPLGQILRDVLVSALGGEFTTIINDSTKTP